MPTLPSCKEGEKVKRLESEKGEALRTGFVYQLSGII
jgi:hypothetical protein